MVSAQNEKVIEYLTALMTTVYDNQGYSRLILNATSQLAQMDRERHADYEVFMTNLLQLEEQINILQSQLTNQSITWQEQMEQLYLLQLNATVDDPSPSYTTQTQILMNLLAYCALIVLIVLIMLGLAIVVIIGQILFGSTRTPFIQMLTRCLQQYLTPCCDTHSIVSTDL